MTASTNTPRKATKAATATVAPVTMSVPVQAPAVEATRDETPRPTVAAVFAEPASTKRFVRYNVAISGDVAAFVATHYLSAEAAAKLGNPSRIRVTVEALGDDEQ